MFGNFECLQTISGHLEPSQTILEASQTIPEASQTISRDLETMRGLFSA